MKRRGAGLKMTEKNHATSSWMTRGYLEIQVKPEGGCHLLRKTPAKGATKKRLCSPHLQHMYGYISCANRPFKRCCSHTRGQSYHNEIWCVDIGGKRVCLCPS